MKIRRMDGYGHRCNECAKEPDKELLFIDINAHIHIALCRDCFKRLQQEMDPFKVLVLTGINTK